MFGTHDANGIETKLPEFKCHQTFYPKCPYCGAQVDSYDLESDSEVKTVAPCECGMRVHIHKQTVEIFETSPACGWREGDKPWL